MKSGEDEQFKMTCMLMFTMERYGNSLAIGKVISPFLICLDLLAS